MRLALLGCGNIVNFHLPALRAAGFDVCAVAASPSSKSVEGFAKDNNIEQFYLNPEDLINESDSWDAVLIASPVSTVIDYIKQVGPTGKPMLVEKPVSNYYEQLEELQQFDNAMVAYNRRFYDSAEYAKNFIENHDDILMRVSIPERRIDPDHNTEFPNRLPLLSYENSVHITDLINYLAGAIHWDAVKSTQTDYEYVSVSALGESVNGITVQLSTYYNSPDNFAIDILSRNERVELKPIEIARHYRGMQVNEPTKQVPIRTYTPSKISEVITQDRNGIKPGFLEQAVAFKQFCDTGDLGNAASLKDAIQALRLVTSLLS